MLHVSAYATYRHAPPAYTVASNAVLEELLRRRPGSAEELIAIRGVGPAFVEKYSEGLLGLLASL